MDLGAEGIVPDLIIMLERPDELVKEFSLGRCTDPTTGVIYHPKVRGTRGGRITSRFMHERYLEVRLCFRLPCQDRGQRGIVRVTHRCKCCRFLLCFAVDNC